MAHYLTQEGLAKVKQELDHLKTVERKEVIESLNTARELGDLKENAEYHDAKDRQGYLESRIAELEAIIKDAVVVTEHPKSDVVRIGSTVVARVNTRQTSFTIVGSEEVNPATGRISYDSPLGKAFLNKGIGEKVSAEVPAGTFEYEILEIN